MKKIFFLLLFVYKISYSQTINLGGTINTYTPILGFNQCLNKITVENASTFNVGDTVLMMQMKGAVVDSSNTNSFGTVTDYKNAGNYEFNYVKNKVGNIIELKNILTRQYDIANGKVQLIRVPYYDNINITSTLTCMPWDGNKGGVLVLNVRNAIDLNADIDVSGKGFKGGNGEHANPASFNCYENQFYYPANPVFAAGKGEGIAILSAAKSNGKGKYANGGGGGNSHNSGGGGGSNAASGGFGGYQYEFTPCTNPAPFDNRGIGANGLIYSNATNRVFLGGGGGAGHANNPELFYPNGGNGGGICIIMADVIKGNNRNILANGDNGLACAGYGATGCHEGMGGGGGAGAILLNANTYNLLTNVKAKGGKGADMIQSGNFKVGPGGGGGGGICWLNNLAVPANLVIDVTAGVNGVCTGYANNAWGTTAGDQGLNLLSLKIPVDTVAFKYNIDSVRINESVTGCRSYDFEGLGYVNTYSITAWNWNFGDNVLFNTQNSAHSYATTGTYNVKLVVTDINGCKDSVVKTITADVCVENTINTYTPVLGFNQCLNKITVENTSTFNVGDTVLMIQMKGAVVDSSNTNSFGTVTDYKNAGNYEFNYVKSKVGNIIELKNILTREYDIANGKVQLIRVPYYDNINITSTLTCMPWDGSKGGVLVLNVRNAIDLNADIDVSGKGFKGGNGEHANPASFNCYENQFYYPANPVFAAGKGEGIAILSAAKSNGKGKYANGGGGGNSHNSGGGGGSNAASGGFGGYQFEFTPCTNPAPFDNRGIGANGLIYSNATNRVFLGGGGGAGHANNPELFYPNGGNGGGICIIIADVIKGNNRNILANGDNGLACAGYGATGCHEGMGGGGGAGAILLNANTYNLLTNVKAKGGKGADMIQSGNFKVGPGGGGGGGICWLNNLAVPANLVIDVTAGVNGVCTGYANNAWGTTAGDQGLNLLSLKIPVDTVAFVDTCVILPVTVRSFTATVIENKSINLNWTVEEEVGIISYTIQRSESGSSGFISLGSLNSKRHEPGKTYSFIDWTAKPNTTYYYRLAILENTGQTKYSITRSAKMDKSDFFITAYPSPTRGLVKIQLSNFNGTANIKIVNNLGQMVFEKKVNENSSFTVTIDLTHQPKGNYWVNVRTDRGTTTKKIIKL